MDRLSGIVDDGSDKMDPNLNLNPNPNPNPDAMTLSKLGSKRKSGCSNPRLHSDLATVKKSRVVTSLGLL